VAEGGHVLQVQEAALCMRPSKDLLESQRRCRRTEGDNLRHIQKGDWQSKLTMVVRIKDLLMLICGNMQPDFKNGANPNWFEIT